MKDYEAEAAARAICRTYFGDVETHGESRCCQLGGLDGCCLHAMIPVAEAALKAVEDLWSAPRTTGLSMDVLERLSAAIHLESAAIAPQTSPLMEAARAALLEIERMRTASDWQPIETAPFMKMVWLWAPTWRHAFPGQRNGDLGQVYIDTCETEARGRQDYATHWMPLPTPPTT